MKKQSKKKRDLSVGPSDTALDRRASDEQEQIRQRLREHEGKEEGKFARANPNYGQDFISGA
jgi:hypothetical protein